MSGLPGRVELVGVGALNVDYIASATRLSRAKAEQVQESVARFEWNTEGPVEGATVAKAIERLGASSLDASLGGSAWLTVFTLAQLRLDLRLGYVGVAGRIETPGLSFLGQMDRLGIDRSLVARRPDLVAGVCLSYLEDVERVLLTHPGANFAMARHLEEHREDVVAYLAAARAVHVTSFLDDATPPVLFGVLAEAKRRSPGLRVSFDPGFDWAQHPSGPVEGILGLADLLFVNHRELKALAGYAVGESDEVLAGRLLERCAAGGTLFVTRRYDAVDVYRSPPGRGVVARRLQLQRPVREGAVEDATGAGDVFAAAVLAAALSGRLHVELGARLGLGLSRHRGTRVRGAGTTPAPALGLWAEPSTHTHAGTVRGGRGVLVAHEGGAGWQDLERFLERDLGLPVHGIALAAAAPPAAGAGQPAVAAAAGPAAGAPAGGVSEELLERCGVAVCVLAATRAMDGGGRRAGEELVHRVGLLQGRYGFARVAILAEEGCEAPSNIAGLIRLDFPPGRIESVFWELERMLEREGFLHGRRPGER